MLTLSHVLGSVAADSEFARSCGLHFSQSGEDIVISQLLRDETTKGMIVDFGAYHPIRFSNTFLFYLQGWRGLNVDGAKSVIDEFKIARPGDVSIHALLSDREETLEFFHFQEGAWNTTDREGAMELDRRSNPMSKITSVETIVTTPAMSILDSYVGNQKFDLLTIDCEGMDKRILLSIDFLKYRPKVIAVEMNLEEWSKDACKEFLQKYNYTVYAQCTHTTILRRMN